MRVLLRPYSRDYKVILRSQKRGAELDGIVVDAQMWRCTREAVSNLRWEIPPECDVLLDPATHKIERPFFRSKPLSYGRLAYFLTTKFPNRPPGPTDLAAHTEEVVRGVYDVQYDFGVRSFMTPALYVAPGDFSPCAKETHFSVGIRWAEAFRKKVQGRPVVLSLCIHVECLRSPDAAREIKAFVRDHAPGAVHLMIVGFDLGQNAKLDGPVFDLLEAMRSYNIGRIIWSHAPVWIYFLRHRGVTDFISGINMQALAKLEYLERDDDDHGAIPNNYYVPWRFCRMTPDQASDAVQRGLIGPCPCPACRSGVPSDGTAIREHYVHTRLTECQELRTSNDPVALLRTRLGDAERFLERAKQGGLAAKGEPTPTLWRRALP